VGVEVRRVQLVQLLERVADERLLQVPAKLQSRFQSIIILKSRLAAVQNCKYGLPLRFCPRRTVHAPRLKKFVRTP
jgi:hypothetical protein